MDLEEKIDFYSTVEKDPDLPEGYAEVAEGSTVSADGDLVVGRTRVKLPIKEAVEYVIKTMATEGSKLALIMSDEDIEFFNCAMQKKARGWLH